LENGYLDLSPTGKGVIFPDGTVQSTASNGSSVTSVSGAEPLGNTGTATNPVISLTGTVSDAKLSNNVDLLNTPQTISGQKTFSTPIISTVTTGAAPMTVSSTTQVSNLNAEMVGGNKLTDLDSRYRLPTQIAVTATTSYSVGTYPVGIAFDGTNIWTTNKNSNNVTKLLASTGATVGTYSVGSKPFGIAFDGDNIWVANSGSVLLTKLRASDGSMVGAYGVGTSPTGITFDGTNIWVTNQGDNTVTKLKASDGSFVGLYSVGASPTGITFDSTNIWVTNQGDSSVTKLLANTGATVGTYGVGTSPTGITFDGTNIWVTNQGDNTVTKLLASTGATVGTYGVGTSPTGIIFDGINVWVTNQNSNNVTMLLAGTGTMVGSYGVGNSPYGIVSDGTNTWVTNQSSNNVSRLATGAYAAIATSGITSTQLASGSVTSTQLAIGSVTSANISGPLSIAVGGTGANTQASAANNILPSQTGNAGKVIGTDGTNASWVSPSVATYRWATFSTYFQSLGWALSNNAAFFGGVTPSTWSDSNGLAYQMSSDKEVLRTLFTQKGYAKKNAMIMNDEWQSYSSTNGKFVTALFRINNTTGAAIGWTPCFYYTAYTDWGEMASVTLNGANSFSSGTYGNTCLTLSIPAGRVSTAIFVSASGVPSTTRNTRLAFYNDSLLLPAGLNFVDDLDTATGGWEQ